MCTSAHLVRSRVRARVRARARARVRVRVKVRIRVRARARARARVRERVRVRVRVRVSLRLVEHRQIVERHVEGRGGVGVDQQDRDAAHHVEPGQRRGGARTARVAAQVRREALGPACCPASRAMEPRRVRWGLGAALARATAKAARGLDDTQHLGWG